MKNPLPTTIKTLQKIIKDGEGPMLEFKRSTGELKEALQTVCAFLNGSGGMLIFGVSPKGTIEGQQVSDKTLREITQALDRFEPPVSIHPQRINIAKEKEMIVLHHATISIEKRMNRLKLQMNQGDRHQWRECGFVKEFFQNSQAIHEQVWRWWNIRRVLQGATCDTDPILRSSEFAGGSHIAPNAL